MLPTQLRITDRYTYNKVKRLGASHHAPSFIVSVLKDKDNADMPTRFGTIITNKVAKSAVVRHRAKRLIATYLQENLDKFGKGNLVVIVGKAQIAGKNYEDISTEFNQVLPKISFT